MQERKEINYEQFYIVNNDENLTNYGMNLNEVDNDIKGRQNTKIELDFEPKHELPTNFNSKNENLIQHDINLRSDNTQENQIEEVKDNLQAVKKPGRKSKNSNEKGIHNKYSQDNIIRKIKCTLLNYIFIFINNTIKNIYDNKIGEGILKKQLKKMNQNQIIDTSGNKIFLYKNLQEIFSEDLSTKYTCYKFNHNRKLIENLLNEKDKEKKIKFEKLFSLTFFDCLMHFRKSQYFEELEGLELLDDAVHKFENDDEYIQLFEYYVNHFEETINKKRTRINKRKK